MNIQDFCYDGSKKFKVKEFDTKQTGGFENKAVVENNRDEHILRLQEYQEKLYAENKEGLLIIFQAMDAAGKDGAVKYVMSGVNPAGVSVYNFKVPSSEELDHDYLWRAMRVAPERGMIAIFNRSYYEDVLVVKVHNLHLNSSLPDRCKTEKIFDQRYEQIKNYEKHLYQNGFRIIKIFLNISKEEQKKQFLQRIDDPTKKLEIRRWRHCRTRSLGQLHGCLPRCDQCDSYTGNSMVCCTFRQEMVRPRIDCRNHFEDTQRNEPTLSGSQQRTSEDSGRIQNKTIE